MDKKYYTYIFVLLGLFLVFLVFLDTHEENKTSYNYTGPGGSFNFSIQTNVSDQGLHVLIYEYHRSDLGNMRLAFPFEYSPMSLEYISSNKTIDDLILDSIKVYLTRDIVLDDLTNQSDYVALLTIARILDDRLGLKINYIPVDIAVISSPSENFEGIVRDCSQGHLDVTVIELRLGQENRIYKEGEYCVIMEFTEDKNPIEIATRLSYQLLGVME